MGQLSIVPQGNIEHGARYPDDGPPLAFPYQNTRWNGFDETAWALQNITSPRSPLRLHVFRICTSLESVPGNGEFFASTFAASTFFCASAVVATCMVWTGTCLPASRASTVKGL